MNVFAHFSTYKGEKNTLLINLAHNSLNVITVHC